MYRYIRKKDNMHIFVFHNGQKRDEITYACGLRIEAASQVARENPDASVCFVGGGGITGSKDMKNFWKKNYSELPNQLSVLEKANNTSDAVKEIAEYVKNQPAKDEVVLISSAYHARRIGICAKRCGLEAEIVAAEDILRKDNKFTEEINAYCTSFVYSSKRLMECMIITYDRVDPEQKMVRRWREYRRSR